MKIGILGGTFNPIHNGHLINAQIIKDDYAMDKILFIPSKHPVHKDLEGNVSPEDRYEMIRLAIHGNEEFDVTRIEIDRKGESFTITTIKQLMNIYMDAKFYLILGSDAFNEIDTWRDFKELVRIASFIVMRRQGTIHYRSDVTDIVEDAIFAMNPFIDISSSQIRENIRRGKSIKYLVPLTVEEYILSKELYRN